MGGRWSGRQRSLLFNLSWDIRLLAVQGIGQGGAVKPDINIFDATELLDRITQLVIEPRRVAFVLGPDVFAGQVYCYCPIVKFNAADRNAGSIAGIV